MFLKNYESNKLMDEAIRVITDVTWEEFINSKIYSEEYDLKVKSLKQVINNYEDRVNEEEKKQIRLGRARVRDEPDELFLSKYNLMCAEHDLFVYEQEFLLLSEKRKIGINYNAITMRQIGKLVQRELDDSAFRVCEICTLKNPINTVSCEICNYIFDSKNTPGIDDSTFHVCEICTLKTPSNAVVCERCETVFVNNKTIPHPLYNM